MKILRPFMLGTSIAAAFAPLASAQSSPPPARQTQSPATTTISPAPADPRSARVQPGRDTTRPAGKGDYADPTPEDVALNRAINGICRGC